MKSKKREKLGYPVFWAVLLLSQLLVNTVCERAHGAKYISFASKRTGNFDIYLINTNGENLRSLTNHPADERSPAWSPDGQSLAYASNQDGIYKIYIMNTKTKEHRRTVRKSEPRQRFRIGWTCLF